MIGSVRFLLALALAVLCFGQSAEGSSLETVANVAHEVRVDHGSIGAYRWAVFIGRGEGTSGRRRPCLKVGFERVPRGMSPTYLSVCGSPLESPLLVSNSSGRGVDERTIVGMAFPRRVSSVRIWLEGRRSRLIALRTVGAEQAAIAQVIRFRYAALAVAGTFCFDRYRMFDSAGRSLSTRPVMPCQD
jgi:hypothetical protein